MVDAVKRISMRFYDAVPAMPMQWDGNNNDNDTDSQQQDYPFTPTTKQQFQHQRPTTRIKPTLQNAELIMTQTQIREQQRIIEELGREVRRAQIGRSDLTKQTDRLLAQSEEKGHELFLLRVEEDASLGGSGAGAGQASASVKRVDKEVVRQEEKLQKLEVMLGASEAKKKELEMQLQKLQSLIQRQEATTKRLTQQKEVNEKDKLAHEMPAPKINGSVVTVAPQSFLDTAKALQFGAKLRVVLPNTNVVYAKATLTQNFQQVVFTECSTQIEPVIIANVQRVKLASGASINVIGATKAKKSKKSKKSDLDAGDPSLRFCIISRDGKELWLTASRVSELATWYLGVHNMIMSPEKPHIVRGDVLWMIARNKINLQATASHTSPFLVLANAFVKMLPAGSDDDVSDDSSDDDSNDSDDSKVVDVVQNDDAVDDDDIDDDDDDDDDDAN